MKVTFKTITNEIFQLSINEDQTILEVKNAIAQSRKKGACPVERQKLIYNGKLLDDSATFDSLEYDMKKFIVLILLAEKKKVEDEAVKTDESTVAATKNEEKAAATESSITPPTSASTTTKAASEVAESSRNSGPLTAENQEKLNNLIGMGYPESEALAALQAAYFVQSRAVEYLINGIPEAAATKAPLAEAEPLSTEDAKTVGLDFLQQNEAFGQIRQMVQGNPEILPEVLQQIASINPALMSAITQNESDFLGLLNNDVAAGSQAANPSSQQQQGGGGTRGRREHVVEVTEEERDAINRLQDMGFPEQLVIEAYLACDKNEELAVDYIIARMVEFHL